MKEERIDVLKNLNDTINNLSDHNKDLQQQNHELTVSYYVMIGVFIITAVMAIVFYNQAQDLKTVKADNVKLSKEWSKQQEQYNSLLL